MPYNSIISRSNAQSLIPEAVSNEVIEALPTTSSFLGLGRRLANMPSNVTRLPVIDVLPTAYFVSGDTGLKQTTNMAWANKFLNAEELAAIVPIPESVLSDTDYDIWGDIRPRITEAMGAVIDRAVYYSTNKPANWPTGIVPAAVAAGNSVSQATNTGDLYDELLGVDGVHAKVEEDGFMVTGAVAALTMKAKMRGLRDENGLPIFNRNPQSRFGYEIDGVPLEFPANGAMDASTAPYIAGDFSQAVYSMRSDLQYKILDQAVLTDNTGTIIYNLAQQDMIALRVVMRLAWQVPNPVNLVNGNNSTRYPFAVLLP